LLGEAWDVRSARDLERETGVKIDWNESGQTFEENSRIKAMALRQHTRSAVLADDSGLAVDALNGAPGIYSSRYGGLADNASRAEIDKCNMLKLLDILKDTPDSDRTARFVCCLVFIDENGIEKVFRGACEGTITRIPKGAYGFGYDPVFFLPTKGKTMAELSEIEKNKISHRSDAVAQFMDA
jgi:XTP/dITP diphosphohydrolase